MDFIIFLFYLFLIALIGIMPFPVMYLFSDFVYLILYKVIGYRKKVVRTNLKLVFPDKNKKELLKIEKGFYKNLTDIFIESFKLNTINVESAKKRFKCATPEVMYKFNNQNRPVIWSLGHIGNWELGPISIPLEFNQKVIIVYKPLANKYINNYIIRTREKVGSRMVSLRNIIGAFREYLDKSSIFILVSDQSPSNIEKAVNVDFFGKKTPFLHGVESFSRKFNIPVIYGTVYRTKRGYYEYDMEVLHENPKETSPGEITQMFASKLEESIKRYPEQWLWSHKKWKHVIKY
jgi:KDO2-lipid IV(A) lauroyltransferase